MRLLTIGEAADQLGVSIAALRKLTDEGRIPFTRLPGGTHRKWTHEQLAEARRRMTIEADELAAEAV